MGGYMAEINSEAEYNFIMNYVNWTRQSGRQTALVGATYAGKVTVNTVCWGVYTLLV